MKLLQHTAASEIDDGVSQPSYDLSTYSQPKAVSDQHQQPLGLGPNLRLRFLIHIDLTGNKKEIVADIAGGIKVERAYAFRKNIEYVNYANSVKERLSQYGYHV